MGGVDYALIFETAIRAISAVLLVNACGALLAFYPKSSGGLLNRGLTQQLASLCIVVLLPALLFFSVGQNFTLELLAEAWVMIPVSLLHIAVGFFSSRFLARLAKVKGMIRRPFVAASCLHNAVAVPLILLTALVDQPPLTSVEKALERGTAYIFLYSFPMTLTMWGFLPWYLAQDNAPDSSLATSSHSKTVPNWRADLKKALKTPTIIALFSGCFVGIVTPLRELIFSGDGVFAPLGKAFYIVGQPAVGLQSIVMAASLGHGLKKLLKKTRKSRAVIGSRVRAFGVRISRKGGVVADDGDDESAGSCARPAASDSGRGDVEAGTESANGSAVSKSCIDDRSGGSGTWGQAEGGGTGRDGMTAKLTSGTLSSSSPLASPGPSSPETSSRDNKRRTLSTSSDSADGADAGAYALTPRQLCILALGRMLFTPALQLLVNLGLHASPVLAGQDRLLIFILFMNPTGPSPMAVINQLQAAGKNYAAESLSQGYILQYFIACITLTGFTAIALQIAFN